MTANQQSNEVTVKHRHRPEGPEKHILVFIFSIILTAIAFAAVMGGEVNPVFAVILLIVMAVLQVFVQMGYWMHLKDKGHLMPILFMIGGFFVASTAIVMALFWVWW